MKKKQNKWVNVGDHVIVVAGNEKGRTGKVLSRTNKSVLIEGLNIRKKHVKPQQRMQQGIVEIEAPIHATNVRICDSENEPVKIKVKSSEDGKRQLIYFKNGNEIVYRDVKKKKD